MAKQSKLSRVIISLLITAVVGFVYFYVNLPALNIHAEEFYGFIMLLCIVYTVSMIVLGGFRADSIGGFVQYAWQQLKLPVIVFGIIVVVTLVGTASGMVIFRAAAYSSLMPVETGDFAEEVAEISLDQIPMLDEDSANILANRKLGELSELVSQFTVSSSSAQINYQGKPVRVTYLNYESFFKWWNNKDQGIPAYMIVDMATQEVDVVKLEEGLKYSPSEYFNRDLNRALRFRYPSLMFENVNFEIDEEGTPYWVASAVTKKIGLFNGEDITNVVLMNAVTGESTLYPIEEVPTWVDRAYSAGLIIEQYNYYGRYRNGYFNTLFSQTDCTTTTSGYNYIAIDDDVWLYTGITSISEDRGNIGFILVNQRTKEARYYSCAGAEEYSAMDSARGAVQQYNYDATFPLLLNIADQPTYFMALKDAGGLVKMYAMVNVQQYQIVATGTSLAQCQVNYRQLLIDNNVLEEEEAGLEEIAQQTGQDVPEKDSAETPKEDQPQKDTVEADQEITGRIADIRSMNMDGDTYYFYQLVSEVAGDDRTQHYYMISAKDNLQAVILNVGDEVSITYKSGEETILEAATISKTSASVNTEAENEGLVSQEENTEN